MKVLGRIFLNSRKDVKTERRKDGKTEFFVSCRRTYVLNKKGPGLYKFIGPKVYVLKVSIEEPRIKGSQS